MTFLFGGVYQGMEEYARTHMGVESFHIIQDADTEVDFSSGAVLGLEKFVLGCVRRGESAVSYFEVHASEWANAVLIGMDFSCGLVPMDAQQRLWREENGRLNNYLAQRADRVVRLFCGLPQVIK